MHKKWLFYLLVILSFFLVILAGTISLNNLKKQALIQWKLQLANTASLTAINIENYFNKYAENLIILSQNPVVKEILKKKNITVDSGYCPLKETWLVHSHEVDAILLLDTSGYIIRRFPPLDNGKYSDSLCPHKVDEDLWLEEKQVKICNVFLNRKNLPAINISCPVFFNDEIIGIIRWMISIDKISQIFFNQVRIGNNGTLWLVDNQGIIRFQSNNQGLGSNIFALQNFHSDIDTSSLVLTELEFQKFVQSLSVVHDSSTLINDPFTEEKSLLLFHNVKVQNLQWTLFFSLPYHEISGVFHQQMAKILSIFIGIVLVLLSIFIRFYRLQKQKLKNESENILLKEQAKHAEERKNEKQKRMHEIIQAQEMERQRFARELHDGIGQLIMTLRLHVQKHKNMDGSREHDFSDIEDILGKIIAELSGVIKNLKPVMLSENSLGDSLRALCNSYSKSGLVSIDFVENNVCNYLSVDYQIAVFRIVQEALTNVMKHANATEVNIQLLGNENQFTLIIQDNGVGFIPDSIIQGNGLRNINDRVSMMNGIMTIESQPGMGTLIQVKVFLNPII